MEDTAARDGSPDPAVLNVNVPDLPAAQLRGLHAARLASYGIARAIIGEPDRGFIPVTFSELDAQPGPGSALNLIRQLATLSALTCESCPGPVRPGLTAPASERRHFPLQRRRPPPG